LRRIQRIIFGIARFGSSLLLSVFSLATIYVYTFIFHLDPVLNGLAMSIGKILMAISGPIIGFISDKRPLLKKLGLRKSYILIGSIILSVSFSLLYAPFYFIDLENQILLFVYELILVSLFDIFYIGTITAYQAMLPEISEPEERAEISIYENFFNGIGGGVGTIFSFLLPLIASDLNLLISVINAFSVLSFLSFFLLIITIREGAKIKTTEFKKEDLKILFKDVNFIFWLIVDGILGIGFIYFTALAVPIIEMIFSEMNITLENILTTESINKLIPLILLFIFSGILGFILTGILSKKMKFKKAFIVLLVPSVILAPASLLMNIALIPSAITFLIGSLFGFIVYNIARYVALANVIELTERRFKKKVAGFYTGTEGVILNIFQAGGYFIVGMLLKYVEAYYLIIGILVSIHTLISIWIIKKKVVLDIEELNQGLGGDERR